MINWQLSKQDIRWPVSPDRTAGSSVDPSRSNIFLKLSADKLPVSNDRRLKFIFSKDSHQICCVYVACGIRRNETKRNEMKLNETIGNRRNETKRNEYCNLWKSQVSQAHVTSLLCKLTFSQESRCRVTNNRWDFEWEIQYWDLRTLNIIILTYFSIK